MQRGGLRHASCEQGPVFQAWGRQSQEEAMQCGGLRHASVRQPWLGACVSSTGEASHAMWRAVISWLGQAMEECVRGTLRRLISMIIYLNDE